MFFSIKLRLYDRSSPMKEAIMYKVIALKRRSLLIKKAFGMAGVAALFIAALFLAGCSNAVGYDAEETVSSRSVLTVPSIYGTWRYAYNYTSGGVQHTGYEEYEITGSGGTGGLSYTFDYNGADDYGLSFAAEIVDIIYNIGDASGVIIIRYTSPPDDGTDTYYNAVYFNNLTAGTPDTVRLANAVNLSDYSNSQVSSSTDAATNFTWTNVGNYVNWSVVNPQERQP
jgi:hypothetical protein